MMSVTSRTSYALRGTAVVIAAAALASHAAAQTPNITTADANVLNLLSPFLGLNATPTGQQTLTINLNNAIAVNQFAASSPTIEAVSISDKSILNAASNSITLSSGATANYGPGANLGGGLPLQAVQSAGGIAPNQPNGGLGSLGTAYQTAVSPSGATVPSVVTLLTNAYSFTSNDLGVAKFYFANGTTNGTTTAIAPSGSTLPTANGLPNTSNSVYDIAYGVSNTGSNQNTFGDSRPSQVAPSQINGYDPTALTGLTSNPSFPSGHTTYGFTDSILIGMMVPQFYQSMLLRGSEFGNSRISLGVHYPIDIIGSRSLVQYDLAQLLNATNPAYLQTNVTSGATAQNLNTQFQTAATALNSYLNTQTSGCGGSLAACAASNPYNAYYAATYGKSPVVSNTGTTTASTDAAIYQSFLTYGLPTLSFTQAPREQAPAGGPDASILLATVYGGSTPQAQALANSVGGALDGNLSTNTINQIIVNTETNAIAAFYGTSLSYWSRINLYAAAGYFQNVTGTIMLASTDQLKINVTVANSGVLGGGGTINGNIAFQSGAALGAQGNGTTSIPVLTVNGSTALQAGSRVQLTGVLLPAVSYKILTTTSLSVDPSVFVDTSASGNLMTLMTGTLSVAADPGLSVQTQANFASAAQTQNQRNVATTIDAVANTGNYGANGATFLANLIASSTAATAPAAFDSLSGEGITGQQQSAINAGDAFARAVLDQNTTWGDDGATVGVGGGATRGHAWATGFGGSGSLDSNGGVGAASLSTQTAGFAIGGDYLVTPTLAIGAAGGYTNSNFSVSSRSTTGTLNGAHFALYGVQHWGDLYLAGVGEYAHYDDTTTRTVMGLGAQGSFSSNEGLGRFEAGYKYHLDTVNVTPLGGFEVSSVSNGGFSETGSAAATAGLNVNGKSVSSDRLFAGFQVDTKVAVSDAWLLVPYARITWEHEFNTDRTMTASFESLPGSGFTVTGAPAASDMARLDTGVKFDVTPAIALYADFDGQFSGAGNVYGGRGGLKVRW